MKKKFLIFLIGLISCLGISSVKASTYSIDYSLSDFSFIIDNETIVKKLYEDLYEKYLEEQAEDYPYYIVTVYHTTDNIIMAFGVYSEPLYIDYNSDHYSFYYNGLLTEDDFSYGPSYVYQYEYNFNNSSYIIPISSVNGVGGYYVPNMTFDIYMNRFYPIYLYYSNFDVKFSTTGGNNLVINNYLNSGNSYTIHGGDTIPTFQDIYEINYISDPNVSNNNYTEIDLNNYSYVALSLKDYTVEQEFSTTMQVLGQYCLTPVYNYGLTERKDILTGSKVQGCSPYYENFTPVRTYVLKSDIENHAIYYLKSYDSTRDNKVKVDTSVFDIHYITLEDEDNPIISIGGHNYPAIPYDSLTDSSTISEAEGYVSGAVCMVGDFNCMSQYTGFNFSDIFNNPINFLKDLWTSITEVFKLVVMFISLLPGPIQYFFYISFMLAIVIGLIKIIL